MLGMSGGTDSSVAAMKLQEAGYEVTGVTLRLHDDGGRGAEEAARLADRLGIATSNTTPAKPSKRRWSVISPKNIWRAARPYPVLCVIID